MMHEQMYSKFGGNSNIFLWSFKKFTNWTLIQAHLCLISHLEPKRYTKASTNELWVKPMLEELDQIEWNKI